MKREIVFVFAVVFVASVVYCAPADTQDTSTDAKSAFGVAFDEIVVDTSLTVKRKDPNRQSRNQNDATSGVAASIIPQKNPLKQ